MRKTVVILLVALAGCSATQEGPFQYQPIVDMKGVDQAKYDRDMAECYGYADKVDVLGDFVQSVGTAALVGAAGGAAIGAVGGSAGAGAALGGGIGGLVGEGNISARHRQELIINRCLINRGYKFLG